MPSRLLALTALLLLFLAGPLSAEEPRQISGIYPHLTTYGVYSQNGAHRRAGHNECGIGAVVPWADQLWMVNYAPHMPRGSEHKLYSVNDDLQLTIHPESVGGTPAGRMIHRESNQLLIAHYMIDSEGQVRAIPPAEMPIRITAIARHLKDPANMVYYIDMEGSIWEANVHTLAVKQLFQKPVPGWHSKGGYTGQGRLVISNNGEHPAGNYDPLLVGGAAKNEEEAGVLAEYDGTSWRIIERRQYTEVTGPAGIAGGGDSHQPIWAIGWDRRSLRLKLLDEGKWHTYLLPKAALCNDARHGWYTEWPRIREITDDRWMMDMHGMFFEFPPTFSRGNSAGIAPIGSHLRYVPDFCQWQDQLVLASDETSIQGNHLAGQPQSNLWFGEYDDLKTWGPASGYGGPWILDEVQANEPSDPFLVAGFDRRMLHLSLGRNGISGEEKVLRASDQLEINHMHKRLAGLPRVTVRRGNWHRPAAGYTFAVDQPVTVYLAVDQRGEPELAEQWQATDMQLTWGGKYRDTIYARDFPAGPIEIPGNDVEHTPGSFGMPHTAFVRSKDQAAKITARGDASVRTPSRAEPIAAHDQPVTFTLQVDAQGNGQWADHSTVEVPAAGYVAHRLPEAFEATWLRLVADRDCIATAFLHQTTAQQVEPSASLFEGLAAADAENARGALLYAAKRDRDLRVITEDDRYFDFTKGGFEFEAEKSDPQLAELLEVEPEFTVDDASVIVEHGGRRLRLPKGHAAFDEPFESGWPRGSREVESERHLANFHGTFYEVPLITNGAPPAFDLMRPVASHAKQINDFCSWNGLLVLAGVKADANSNTHVYANQKQEVGLWLGGVDDLWQLGKPVGQGGPWKETPVKAAQPSDAYLMTGYDRKTLTLEADAPTTVTIEVDFDHQSGWHRYKSFELSAGKPITYEFPAAFSAHWIRFTSAADCTATAWLEYE